jgi:hypothetical protein
LKLFERQSIIHQIIAPARRLFSLIGFRRNKPGYDPRRFFAILSCHVGKHPHGDFSCKTLRQENLRIQFNKVLSIKRTAPEPSKHARIDARPQQFEHVV